MPNQFKKTEAKAKVWIYFINSMHESVYFLSLFNCENTNNTRGLNNSFLRERGLTSTPKMEYQVFLCIFQRNLAMATIGLKKMGKFLWESREKFLPCWLSQFSFASRVFWKKNYEIYLGNLPPHGIFWFQWLDIIIS